MPHREPERWRQTSREEMRWSNSPQGPNHEEKQPSCCPARKHSSPPPLGALPDFRFVGRITQALSCPVGYPCKYRPAPGLCRGSVAGHLHHLQLAGDKTSREKAVIQFWPIPGLPLLLITHKWSGPLCSIPILAFCRATPARNSAIEQTLRQGEKLEDKSVMKQSHM